MGKMWRVDSQRKIADEWARIKKDSDRLLGLGQGLLITIIIALLFYKSIAGLLCGIVIVPFWYRQYLKDLQEKNKRKLQSEFKEYMTLLSNSLQAGYSLERALTVAEQEMKKINPEKSILFKHIHKMNQKISMNVQVEKAFEEFALETGLEEAISLSEILMFAKRSGGDYGKHIRNTALKIEEKIAVEEEINTVTTEKRLELKVMCFMPLGILAYISLTSKEFIAPLYGTTMGIIVMTASLIGYGAMIILGRKIVAIDV